MGNSDDHQDWSRATELFYEDKLSLEKMRSIADQASLSEVEKAVVNSTLQIENTLRRKRENLKSLKELERRLEGRSESLKCLTVDLAKNVRQIAERFMQVTPESMRADKPDDDLKSLCDINCSLKYAPPGEPEYDLKLIRYLNNEWNLLIHRPNENVVAIEIKGQSLTLKDGVFSLPLADGDNSLEQRVATIAFQEMILTFEQGQQLAILFV